MLPTLFKEHNNTKHRSIKMTPVFTLIYISGDVEHLISKPKFKIGDHVRISKRIDKVIKRDYK